MTASIHTIAKKCRVSISTVSRVFNERGNVREETRLRILKAAKKHNYRPKIQARQDIIAVLMGHSERIEFDIYESFLLSEITSLFFQHSLPFRIMPIRDLEQIYTSFARVVLCLSFSPESERSISRVEGIPAVTVNTRVKGHHAVCVDHFEGAAMAVRHLVEKGHQRIAFFQVATSAWGNCERLRGYRETMAQCGLTPMDADYPVNSENTLFSEMARLVRKRPTALIVSGEGMALRATHILSLLGIRIPEDLSVITYENPRVSPYLIPAPTTISQNLAKLAGRAVDMVAGLYDNPDQAPACNFIDNSLIERDSVRMI